MLLADVISDTEAMIFFNLSKMTKTNLFLNLENVERNSMPKLYVRQREQLLCHIKTATAFCDAQIPVAKDITENKKLNKDKDAAY
jgi:hypothetical protein